ncbi:MAG TPA: S53 family peptidase [Gammaproteobacteria bacterium]|nr:S53 family peptidase [Gammaproteobacteria bacterium]
MSTRKSLSLICSLVSGVALTLGATSAMADVQPTGATPADETITTTIVFNVTHPKELARYIRETVTPGSPHYRDFLSVQEFVVHYAPHHGQLQKTASYLESFGIKVDKIYADHLAMTVSGPVSAFNQVFNTELANYQETEPAVHPHRRAHFYRPKSQPHLPKLLQDNGVLAVVGLSNEYQFKPMSLVSTSLKQVGSDQIRLPTDNTLATQYPGEYTVGDVAELYNITPLYEQGVDGKGMTVGVATFAAFSPDDAYAYWNMIGLNYKPDRITQIHVDGGGAYGARAGTGETSLDVEQSGGLAPFADVVVYDAPNTSSAGVDMFYQIVSDNRVDSLSYSWGLPEMFYMPEMNGGVDFTSTLQSMNQAFMEAAVQGISLFAASGDAGAYDTTRSLPPPYFSAPLTVDAPASSPYMTAAGGTTVPDSFGLVCRTADQVLTIATERAWSWDYLADYLQTACGYPPAVALGAVFSVGDGGGVSIYWPRPWYQKGMAGMQNSMPDQKMMDYTVSPPDMMMALPAGFVGRNVPDISMNADPETGYLVYSTPDGGLIAFYGGTSFVAPQLNGITALIGQKAGSRIGLLNAQLYQLLDKYGYGPKSPFNDMMHGNNWFWQGVPGYDPATGVGTPNVAQLAAALSAEPSHAH